MWPAILTVLTLPLLIGLGTWQLQRMNWKADLIAKLEARAKAEPVSYTAALGEFVKSDPDLKTGDVEYLRVRVTGFSDYFVNLNGGLQDEIIARTEIGK